MDEREVTVLLDGDGGKPFSARYDTTAAQVDEFARDSRRSRDGDSRGSLSSRCPSATSFVIAAVTENRAREVVCPHELLLWSVIDSASYAETMSLLHMCQVFPLPNGPVEVLVADPLKPGRVNHEIMKRFVERACRVVPIARKHFE
ncbi:TPA: hypothetical protein N0F65_002819 [Lagenidium giganteum]|uniref:Uncharacterized protein n=1 Tax=Lagenidium giganteum TaxID=4803 RepID=A0AAV2ZAS3_9STRA|nr:TPA: hypothetical protein N0F65_002819 [Lagenidium giganteum]